MSAIVQRPWRTLSDEEKEERKAAWEEEQRKASEFSDHKLSDETIAAYIGETLYTTRKMLAEGRIMSRWAEDVHRFRARRDSQPQPGKSYPPKGNGRKGKAEEAEHDDQTELEDSEETLEADE